MASRQPACPPTCPPPARLLARLLAMWVLLAGHLFWAAVSSSLAGVTGTASLCLSQLPPCTASHPCLLLQAAASAAALAPAAPDLEALMQAWSPEIQAQIQSSQLPQPQEVGVKHEGRGAVTVAIGMQPRGSDQHGRCASMQLQWYMCLTACRGASLPAAAVPTCLAQPAHLSTHGLLPPVCHPACPSVNA